MLSSSVTVWVVGRVRSWADIVVNVMLSSRRRPEPGHNEN